MNCKDVILVTEQNEDEKIRYLLNFEDYFNRIIPVYGNDLDHLACMVKQLYQSKENYGWVGHGINNSRRMDAKFCSGEMELRRFLCEAKHQTDNDMVFEAERCSKECIDALRACGLDTDGKSLLGVMHYEKIPYQFKQGEILHNLNGCDYIVLELLSKKNLLLMALNSGQYVVANNTSMFERYPKDEDFPKEKGVRGIEWGKGYYLGDELMDVNLQELRQVYGERSKRNTVAGCRKEAKRQFNLYKWLTEDEELTSSVKWAATESLYKEFGTTTRQEFENSMNCGKFDERLPKKQNYGREKVR